MKYSLDIKSFFFMILFVLVLITDVHADDWSDEDTTREIAYQVLSIMDYEQTKYISRNCDRYYEGNPILGRCPNGSDVDAYFLLTGLAHYGISRLLSHEQRKTWQNLTIGFQFSVVLHNVHAGIKIEW
jgi:hypothetical protein